MIYIVSGYKRCGTSMMMESLIAGGMDASYSPSRSAKMNEKWGDPDKVNGYKPNTEYFELERDQYRELDFPKGFEGKLIKCLWTGTSNIAPGEYRVVFMRRPRIEIARSLLAFFGHVDPPVEHPNFDTTVDKLIDVIRDRRSFISVDEVWYNDVVSNPLDIFTTLKNKGWPIDPVKAASVPNTSKKRQVAA